MANDIEAEQAGNIEEHYIHKCDLCKYTWVSKKILPKACPKCKRYDWNGGKKSG